jgi:hypothetical protein
LPGIQGGAVRGHFQQGKIDDGAVDDGSVADASGGDEPLLGVEDALGGGRRGPKPCSSSDFVPGRMSVRFWPRRDRAVSHFSKRAPEGRADRRRTMSWFRRVRWFGVSLLFVLASGHTAAAEEPPVITGEIKAVGISGASAVAQVGFFHPGGPIHDKPAFAAFTERGRILDKDRVLVTSSSNFGAPRAIADAPEGAVLSLDLDGPMLEIPADFAA